MKRDCIDFHRVDDAHLVMHARLENWARWVSPRRQGWSSAAIWRMGKPNGRQWHAPELRPAVDELDAAHMERAVRRLPHLNRDAIRWCYCFKFIQPFKIRKELGVTEHGLMLLIEDARAILRNRRV